MFDFLQYRWVYHSLLWLAVLGALALGLLSGEEQPGPALVLKMTGVILAPVAMGIYAVFYLRETFFARRKYFAFASLSAASIAASVAFSRLLHHFFPVVDTSLPQDAVNITAVVLLALGLQYLKRGLVGQYQLQELRARNAEVELNALKAQINPHFLFNTLNNIYATIQLDAEKGGDMVMELSEVMRYHLKFSQMDRVSLAEELDLLRSYIALEKLRLSDACELKLDIEEVKGNLKIAPLIFLPFLENAFKHGTHPVQSCFIHLNIRTEGNRVIFDLKNSILPNRKTVRTHLGQENTRQRLRLSYPQRHALEIIADEDVYSVLLNIRL